MQDERIAVILVDHGSRFDDANAMLLDVVKLIQDLSGHSRVYPAHMELAEPTIQQAFERAVAEGATAVVVHPYFLSPGRHSMADIPRMVQEAAARHPGVEHCVTAKIWLTTSCGSSVSRRMSRSSGEMNCSAREASRNHCKSPSQYFRPTRITGNGRILWVWISVMVSKSSSAVP